MSEHQEYPMTMAHPGYQAARSVPVPGTEKRGPHGNVISCDYQGTPEKLPPVTVSNADEREYYESQGYEAAGKSDPSAYAMAHASPAPPDYVPLEYPKYRDGILLNSAEEEAEKFPPALSAPEPEPVAVIETDAVSAEDVAQLRIAYEDRFGKRPFMGWNAETLKEKLAA